MADRIRRYDSRDDAILAVAALHGLCPTDLDLIPGESCMYLSFGPADEDVVPCRWEEESDETFAESCARLAQGAA